MSEVLKFRRKILEKEKSLEDKPEEDGYADLEKNARRNSEKKRQRERQRNKDNKNVLRENRIKFD